MRKLFLLLIVVLFCSSCIFDSGKVTNKNSAIIGLWQECNAPNNTILFRADATYNSTNLFGSGGYLINPQALILISDGKPTEYKYLINGNLLSIIHEKTDLKPPVYYDFIQIN